jgi:hypothetical protein
MAERGRLVMKRIAIIAATGCASRSGSTIQAGGESHNGCESYCPDNLAQFLSI